MAKIFVSSTIYDFADLRSALKFYLEGLGFEVLLSEANDFPKDAAENSYAACLKAIETCDYFILLVGSRIGGMADKTTSTTITMAEYRRARQLADAHKLKIISLVRRDLWTVREDRADLAKFLKRDFSASRELADEAIDKVAGHPGKFTNDAAVLFDFLREIGRVDEMSKASEGQTAAPPGNWIHTFVTFTDVVDALRVQFSLPTSTLKKMTFAALVAGEIDGNVRELLRRNKDRADPVTFFSEPARAQFRGGVDDNSSYKGRHILWLFAFFGLSAPGSARRLRSVFLRDALISGAFLRFDKLTAAFVETPLHRAMRLLEDALEHARRDAEEIKMPVAMGMIQKAKRSGDAEIVLDNMELVWIMSLHDALTNVLQLSKCILAAISAQNEDPLLPTLLPRSPFADQQGQIANETPTADDVLTWLKE